MKLVVKYIVEIDGQIKEEKNIVEVDLPYGQIDEDDSRKINPETSNDFLSVMSRGNIYTGDDIEFQNLTKEIESQEIIPDLKIGMCSNGHILRADYGTGDYFHLFKDDRKWFDKIEHIWNREFNYVHEVKNKADDYLVDNPNPTKNCLPTNVMDCAFCGCNEYYLLKDLMTQDFQDNGFDNIQTYNEVSLDEIKGECLTFHKYDSDISESGYLERIRKENGFKE